MRVSEDAARTDDLRPSKLAAERRRTHPTKAVGTAPALCGAAALPPFFHMLVLVETATCACERE